MESMKTHELMTLALRVVAVIIGAYACVDLSNIVTFLIDLHVYPKVIPIDSVLTSLGGYAVILWSIPMIVALLLWWLAPRLARLASRGADQGADQNVELSGVDVEWLTHGAFVVVGVWILIFGAIGLLRIGVDAWSVAANSKWGGAPFPWDYFAAYVLRCLFGLVLIIGGRELSRMLLRLRTAGTE